MQTAIKHKVECKHRVSINIYRQQLKIVICSILYQRDFKIIHTKLPSTQNQTIVESNRNLKHVIQACHKEKIRRLEISVNRGWLTDLMQIHIPQKREKNQFLIHLT